MRLSLSFCFSPLSSEICNLKFPLRVRLRSALCFRREENSPATRLNKCGAVAATRRSFYRPPARSGVRENPLAFLLSLESGPGHAVEHSLLCFSLAWQDAAGVEHTCHATIEDRSRHEVAIRLSGWLATANQIAQRRIFLRGRPLRPRRKGFRRGPASQYKRAARHPGLIPANAAAPISAPRPCA